jgi:hypothetical protein
MANAGINTLDANGWNTGDYVAVVLTTVLSLAAIIGLGAALYNPVYRTAIMGSLGAFFFAIVNFIPFGFITFGFIADIIGQDFRYSIASIVGLLSIVLNFMISLLTGSSVISAEVGPERPGPAWCMIPGLEKFENKMMPMSIVSSWAILSYYVIFAGTNRTTVQNTSIYVSIGLLSIVQLATFYGSDCSMFYEGDSRYRIFALLLGVTCGVIGWAVVSSVYPSKVPFPNTREGMLSGSGWDGSVQSPTFEKLTPRTGAQCSKDESEQGDEFVCEAYKNGQLVTEKINS